jgi:copper(I)-binding protein
MIMAAPGSPARAGRPGWSRWPAADRAAVAACLLAATAAVAGCAQQAAAAPIAMGTAYVNMPSSSGTTQAYLIIQNNGAADRVTSARTSAGGTVTFRGPVGHGVSAMRAVPDIAIPARATVRLIPDGFHLLITGARRMRAGTEITLTLVFARAGKMSVSALVTNPETGGSSYLGD